MKKTVYFETLGCPKNVYDTSYASGILKDAGYETVGEPEDASFIVVNTCGFIEDAKKESISAILDMAAYREDGRFLVVTGCLSQRYGNELNKEMPEIDGALGVGEYDRLPALLDGLAGFNKNSAHNAGDFGASRTNRHSPEPLEPVDGIADSAEEADALEKRDSNRLLDTILSSVDIIRDSVKRDNNRDGKIHAPAAAAGAASAYLKIADGCDNSCAYCVIPYIRGPYKSRHMEELLEEAGALAAAGTKEVILVAQDTTAYGLDIYGRLALPELLRGLCRIDGIKWLRLMYCYDDRVTDELVRVMAEEKKICRYIDMPIQHASDKILGAMGRRSTKAGILEALAKLRGAMPDVRIRTTLICGFPGETKAEFDEMEDFAAKTRFDRLGVFAYSKEEGTPAALMEGQVRRDAKERRLDRIMNLQRRISLELNEAMIGRELEVLVEEENEDGSFSGRTEFDAPEIDNGVIFQRGGYAGEVKPGAFVRVRITDAFDYDLVGEAYEV